ncbi:MAG: hypothetical protein K2M98_03615, partial [Muribaculum sp.]|nr:hypothetical protein [Muribaculum sp.]
TWDFSCRRWILLVPAKNKMKKSIKFFSTLVLVVLATLSFSSCSDKDDDPSPSKSIVGTWIYSSADDSDGSFDDYTLVFKSNNTGYIINEYGTRASASEQMNFDWSLTTTSDGTYRLSVIYKSGDKYMDGPFGGDYAQWNRVVTIAGKTLSINMNDNTVMLFHRK